MMPLPKAKGAIPFPLPPPPNLQEPPAFDENELVFEETGIPYTQLYEIKEKICQMFLHSLEQKRVVSGIPAQLEGDMDDDDVFFIDLIEKKHILTVKNVKISFYTHIG